MSAATKRILLHIGQSKTGTSAIQEFCAANREKLKADGFYYPTLRALNLVNHNTFAESFAGIKRYPGLTTEEYWQDFQKDFEASDCHTMLISGESFWGIPQIWAVADQQDFLNRHARKLQNMKKLCQEYPVKILLYLRPQEEWLESAIAHIIRYEGLLGKKVYQDDTQIAEFLAPHLDYERLIDLWQEELQPEKFEICVYKRQNLVNGDSVSDFLQRIDSSLKPTGAMVKDENTSWPEPIVELKKWLNTKPHSKSREKAWIAVLNQMADQFPDSPKYRMTPDIKERVQNEYRSSNEALGEKYCLTGSLISEQAMRKDKKTEPNQSDFEKARRAFYTLPTQLKIEALVVFHKTLAFMREKTPGIHRPAVKSVKYVRKAFGFS